MDQDGSKADDSTPVQAVDSHEFENIKQENQELRDRLGLLMQSLQETNVPWTKKQVEEVKKILNDVGTKNEKAADSTALKNHILYLEEKMGILEEEN